MALSARHSTAIPGEMEMENKQNPISPVIICFAKSERWLYY